MARRAMERAKRTSKKKRRRMRRSHAGCQTNAFDDGGDGDGDDGAVVSYAVVDRGPGRQ